MDIWFYLSSKNRCTPSAYILFCKENRSKITQQFPLMRASDVSSLLSELWRKLPEEKKEEYRERVGIVTEYENTYPNKPLYSYSTQMMAMGQYSKAYCNQDYVAYTSNQVINNYKLPPASDSKAFHPIKTMPSFQELQPMTFIPRYVKDIPPLVQHKAKL